MIRSAVAVSSMFANKQVVTELLHGKPAAERSLEGSLQILKACTHRVDALGPAPARFKSARAAAVNVCGNFEAGAGLVHAGLIAVRGGLGAGLLTQGGKLLLTGVHGIRTVANRMPPTS